MEWSLSTVTVLGLGQEEQAVSEFCLLQDITTPSERMAVFLLGGKPFQGYPQQTGQDWVPGPNSAEEARK